MMNKKFSDPVDVMQRAIELARLGRGYVEPNPAVGAVIVNDQLELMGEGYHQQYGGPHAEVNAFRMAGEAARGAILYVTLEPCNHHGKTPPCSEAVIAAGIRKVVIGSVDPAPHTHGQGIQKLRNAGIEVETGFLKEQTDNLIRPFAKKMLLNRPYVHAKWAMTLDGKIATRTGSSRWISNSKSRQIVHELRGRMDGILVGSGTMLADDPLLTVRPPGPRIPTRIVLDSRASLSTDSRLVRSLEEAPVLVVCSDEAEKSSRNQLREAGVEILEVSLNQQGKIDVSCLLGLLGERGMTNLLVEGGAEVLGSFLDQQEIDEVHVFIAPKLVGGKAAPTAVSGIGIAEMSSALQLQNVRWEQVEGDLYLGGECPSQVSR